MKIHTIAGAALALLATSCATASPDYAKTPPAPGPDIYRCVDSTGYVSFVLVKAGTAQHWFGDHWGRNICEVADSRCKTDDEGLFVVETTTVISRTGDRIDTIEIYNPKAETVLSTMALNGFAGEPHRDVCKLHV